MFRGCLFFVSVFYRHVFRVCVGRFSLNCTVVNYQTAIQFCIQQMLSFGSLNSFKRKGQPNLVNMSITVKGTD